MNQHRLGERRFVEYPLFAGADLQRRLRRTRRALLAVVALGVVAAGLVLLVVR